LGALGRIRHGQRIKQRPAHQLPSRTHGSVGASGGRGKGHRYPVRREGLLRQPSRKELLSTLPTRVMLPQQATDDPDQKG